MIVSASVMANRFKLKDYFIVVFFQKTTKKGSIVNCEISRQGQSKIH